MHMLSWVVGLVCIAVAAADSADIGSGKGDWIVVADGITLQVVGHSGKIRLHTTTANGTNSVEVSFNAVQEVDEAGDWQAHSTPLAATDFEWSHPEYEEVEGVNTTVVHLTTELRVVGAGGGTMVPFNCTLRFYHETGNTTFGDQTYTILKNHVKFTLHFGSWPFESTSNSLEFSMELKAKDKSANPATIDPIHGDPRQRRVVLSDSGTFDLVSSALVDGIETPINSSLYHQGSKSGVVLRFPYFATRLDYDPTLGLFSTSPPDPTNPDNGSPSTVGVVVGCVVGGVVLLALVFVAVRKYRASSARPTVPLAAQTPIAAR